MANTKLLEQEIRKLASFDPLTHLPNRRFFAMEINRSRSLPALFRYAWMTMPTFFVRPVTPHPISSPAIRRRSKASRGVSLRSGGGLVAR
mgnify:CR=1 FL=1